MTDAGRPALERRLGLRDAVVLGLGSMVGAGIFAAVGPASDAARGLLPLAVLLAGAVAWLNATSSGRLAAVHPQAGGTYVYATERLGRRWGHLAGWAFVVGKTASCAAMAYTVGAYAWPGSERWVALVVLALVVVLGTGGIQKGARLTRVLLGLALVALAVVVVGAWTVEPVVPDDYFWSAMVFEPPSALVQVVIGLEAFAYGNEGLLPRPYGVLQAAGLMFFAFAGYARIATLGEEVRDPRRTIPRAIGIALAITVALYLVVVVSLQYAFADVGAFVWGPTPLADVARGLPGDAGAVVVRVGAVAAASGALLGLLLGVSRTTFAMARDGHLPWRLTHVRHGVPDYAELAVAGVVALVVLVADLRHVIGFSSVTVLTYYAITHLAARRLAPEEGRPATAVLALGLVGCVVLALTLPFLSVVAGVLVLLVGVVVGRVTTRRAPAQ